MNWPLAIVLGLLVVYLVSETTYGRATAEGFAVPRRSDIGLSRDGWGEQGLWERDLRYSEAFVDIAGRGVAADFCRAVRRRGDDGSLQMACAVGTRDGMDTMEYTSPTQREGFRFSRDDYWRSPAPAEGRRRMDYCRILRDDATGEWFAGCAIAGPDGFKKTEEHDTAPPPAIRDLLDAYEGALVWWRWLDDEEDYIGACEAEVHGNPRTQTILRPEKTRGLELNRWPVAAQAALEPAPPLKDYLRWGETKTLSLHDKVPPRQIRAIAFWIFWDAVERGATIVEASNGKKKDLIRLYVAGGGPALPSPPVAREASEVRPDHRLAIGQLTQPAAGLNSKPIPSALEQSGAYVFEIWDEDQRLMRMESGPGTVVANTWQHVVVTTTDSTTYWPTWQMYIDGALAAEKRDGRMSPALELTQNYIGKGVRGCLQDFRVYREAMLPTKIEAAIAWGRPRLHPTP